MSEMNYQKEEVLPYMKGLWKEALQSICGLQSITFNKKHQMCPHCGGSDRFRWTDNISSPGDGGAICNQCGNDSGVGWMMKLTGEPYSEVINILGRFLGKVPQDYKAKAYRVVSRVPEKGLGKMADHESCVAVMERTEKRESTDLSVYECLTEDSYDVGVKVRQNGTEELIHALPCYMVHPDGIDEDMCNVMFAYDNGEYTFLAHDYSRGSVVKLGSGEADAAIYMTSDLIDGYRVKMATSQEVWVTFSPENLEIVAYRYRGDRELRVACPADDLRTLYMADERDLKVVVPNNGNFKMGLERKLYTPQDLIDKYS